MKACVNFYNKSKFFLCRRAKAASAIGLLCNLVCLVASLLRPYMPHTVETLAKQINLDLSALSISETFQPFLKTGHKIGKVRMFIVIRYLVLVWIPNMKM